MRESFPYRSRRDSASVLILTLWALGLLAVFALAMGYAARAKLDQVDRLNQYAMLRHIAKAGISAAKARLQAFYYIPDNESGATSTWALKYHSGLSMETKSGDGLASVFVSDEEARLNINTAPRDALARLFQYVARVSEADSLALADAVIDWRDADAQAQPSGAEDGYYASLDNPYNGKDAPLDSADELLLVRGFAGKIYDDVASFVTVYGVGRVNINTAAGEVLLAIGLDAALVERILLFRAGADQMINTEDDGYFWLIETDPSGKAFVERSQKNPIVFTQEEDNALGEKVAQGLLGVASWYFRAQSMAIRGNRPGGFTIVACFGAVPGPTGGTDIKLVFWRTFP